MWRPEVSPGASVEEGGSRSVGRRDFRGIGWERDGGPRNRSREQKGPPSRRVINKGELMLMAAIRNRRSGKEEEHKRM